MNSKAREYIQKLQLKKHPEGGYYREIYRSGEIISATKLPKRYKSSRAYSTSIYFLLEGNQFSSFHKLQSDETWHFYDGVSVQIYIIDTNGNLEKKRVGENLNEGDDFQLTIFKDRWFAAELTDKKNFALIGCTVSPGFDFNDFELAKREELINLYPDHSALIKKLTHT
jgi:uncharacterized protein